MMVAAPRLKALPQPHEQTFIDTARRIREKRLTRLEDIPTLPKHLSEKAVALLTAMTDFDEPGFWKSYDALSEQYSPMKEWRQAIEIPAPPDQEQESAWGKYKPITLLEMARRPRPNDLIEDIIYENTVAVLFGAAGTKKSFLGFDWFAHICMNMPWQGHAIKKSGPCVYTVAEGADNFIKRAFAWCAYYHVPLETLSEKLFLVEREIPLSNSAEISEYIDDVRRFLHDTPPVAVAFDTLMRCSAGGNINLPDVMGQLYNGANEIRRELKAAHALIVHHEGKDSTKGSAGSFVLRANCDIAHHLTCDPTTGGLTLSCDPSVGGKMKDKAEYPDIYLNTRPVYYTEEMAKDDSSLVIVGDEKPAPKKIKLTPSRQVSLDALSCEKGTSYSEWRAAIDTALVSDGQPAMIKPTYDKCREWLIERSLVRKDAQGFYWRVQGCEEEDE